MIEVACAIIRNETDEVLIVQRGEATDHPLKWEFPGGKVNTGEKWEDCIVREIKEELDMEIVICGHLPEVNYDYGNIKIKLIPFICDTLEECPFLSEHIDFKWISPYELDSIDFLEADIVVARSYSEQFGGTRLIDVDTEYNEITEISVELALQTMINNLMSMQEADWIATSAIENSQIFSKLLEYSFSTDKKLAFRASWTLTKVCDKYPEMIYPHLIRIIDALDKLDNESVQRSFLRILSLTDLDEISIKYHGILAEHCFNALRSGFSAIAIKAYSMEIIYQLALKYPGLANELSASISMLQSEGSPGIVARGRIILKKLSLINQ
jgi:8-oxo-dGTP diphosphatase